MHLVFDIGGTKTRIASSTDGKTLSEVKIIPTSQDFNEGINSIKKIAQELAGTQKIDSAAGGLAGPLDKNKTMLVSSPHLGSWVNKPFKAELEKMLDCQVYLENDTAICGLGEAHFGAGKGKKIVVYLTISTGVGGVKIENGKIDENALGFEPGHQIIVPEGNLCGCGGKGHLEAYISGTALHELKGVKAEEIKDPVVWDKVARYLSIGLNNVCVFWSPEIIILGGAVMQSIDLEKVKEYLKEDLTIFPTPPEVVLSENGDNSGLFGALNLVGSN